MLVWSRFAPRLEDVSMESMDFLEDLEMLGIRSSSFERNLSYDELFILETENDAELTAHGAVAVDAGAISGPVPRFVVKDGEGDVWWDGVGHHAMSPDSWNRLKDVVLTHLNGKALYVMDVYCGASSPSRIGVRVITELPWRAHFAKNMFVRPSEEELKHFQADWIVLDAGLANPDPESFGVATPALVAAHFGERITMIAGACRDEEMKQAVFTVMNSILPNKGVGVFRCSANQGIGRGDCALFFGAAESGKSTLAIDGKRLLIGDDEHGWDHEGIFNLEGGYFAKPERLPRSTAPLIRKDALLEQDELGDDRISLPLHLMQQIVRPVSRGGHPETIFFLACDAFGVLPPLAKLSLGQAQYHYLSGYSTQGGRADPIFSACYDEASLLLHPLRYAEILLRKMRDHGTQVFLVNSGWIGGSAGQGHRMGLDFTRHLIDAVLAGAWDDENTDLLPIFQLRIPRSLPGVEAAMLDPRLTWEDRDAYYWSLKELARRFVANFERFDDSVAGRRIAVDFGPQLG